MQNACDYKLRTKLCSENLNGKGTPRPVWDGNIEVGLEETGRVGTGLIWLKIGISGGLF
jgi:hypothetical protein